MNKIILLSLIFSLFLMPGLTYAYGGPGSVISGVGALIALIVTIIVSIFGFLWFPIKRLYKKLFMNQKKNKEDNNSKSKQEN